MIRWGEIQRRPGVRNAAYSALAIAAALLIGAGLIYASGRSVVEAYSTLFTGALVGTYNIANTLMLTTPLLFAGLAVAFAFQAGLFNIGVEGQLYVGGLAAAIVGLYGTGLPTPIHVTLALLAGAVGGGLWALLPAYLKARVGAHEVVTTIMMNYVGILLTTLLVKTYFKEAGPVNQTAFLPYSARMAELIPGTRLSWAIILGVAVAAGIEFLLKRTAVGFEIRAVGENPAAAEYAGVNPRRQIIIAMVISGAIAGLAGASVVMGTLYRFIANFSPGYGFTGIAVALLGRNQPWGVVPAALLFGALQSGGMSMQLFARIPLDLMTVVQGLVILFVAAPALIAFVLERPRRGSARGGPVVVDEAGRNG